MRVKVSASAQRVVDETIDQTLDRLGKRVKDNARRIVPIKTGDLQRSIIAQRADGVLQVGVDVDIAGVNYGPHVEQGTSKAAAQPFLRPAVLQTKGLTL
jgi:HK97 gp10 family phage protein